MVLKFIMLCMKVASPDPRKYFGNEKFYFRVWILTCEVFWLGLLLEKKLEKCPEDQVRGLIGI